MWHRVPAPVVMFVPYLTLLLVLGYVLLIGADTESIGLWYIATTFSQGLSIYALWVSSCFAPAKLLRKYKDATLLQAASQTSVAERSMWIFDICRTGRHHDKAGRRGWYWERWWR